MPSISAIHSVNAGLCGVFGILFNILLIWLIMRRSVPALRLYRSILLQTCIIDIYTICLMMVVQPIYVVVSGWNISYLNGPARFLPLPYSIGLNLLWYFGFYFSITSNALQFFYRYLVLCSRNDFRQIISKLLKSDLEPEKIMPGRDREEEPLDVENRSGIEIRISAASDTINFATERDCLTVEPGANPDDIQSRAENIGSNVLSHAYQLVLFLITQSGYLVVVASMLSTNFFEPSKSTCDAITTIATNNTFPDIEGHQKILEREFRSLLVEWQDECSGSKMTIYISTAVMLGAIFGSFGCGYLADRLGRKPVVVGCMLTLCLGNAIIGLLGGINRVFAVMIFFILGSASGGYIVTNMVFIVEAVSDSRTRLLVVSLNGWPAGMIFTAILGWLTQNWRVYHLTCSALSIICVTFLECFCKESIRWLLERGDTLRAMKIHTEIQRQYERCCKRPQEINKSISPSPSFSPKSPDENSNTEVNNAQRPPRKYSYLDLFRHKSISVPLLVLVYCFFSSSVVSFGLIFSAEVLPGDRYLNLAGMGLGKLVLGLVPYMVSRWFGRRPIILVSVGVACVSCGALILTWTLFRDSAQWLITALGLSLVAAMDPTWKINHLYSMELFPTPVRNMARGVCSVMSRVGSLAGPFVIFLRTYNDLVPFWMFLVLLIAQWIISYFLLPETRHADLPQNMPTKKSRALNQAKS